MSTEQDDRRTSTGRTDLDVNVSAAGVGSPNLMDQEAQRAASSPIPSPQLGSVDGAGMDSLGRLLLASESMASVLHRAAGFAQRSLPSVIDASVTLTDGHRAATAAWAGLLAFELDECQYGFGFGPCLAAAQSGLPMVIDDTRTDPRWPDFSAMAARQGALSNLSVPIPLLRGRSRAALNLYSDQVGTFSTDLAVAGATHVAEQIAAAITNKYDLDAAQREVETLQTALESRAVIEQAKGVLMALHGYDPVEAFRVMSIQSQNNNTKLRDIAARIVEHVRRSDSDS